MKPAYMVSVVVTSSDYTDIFTGTYHARTITGVLAALCKNWPKNTIQHVMIVKIDKLGFWTFNETDINQIRGRLARS